MQNINPLLIWQEGFSLLNLLRPIIDIILSTGVRNSMQFNLFFSKFKCNFGQELVSVLPYFDAQGRAFTKINNPINHLVSPLN